MEQINKNLALAELLDNITLNLTNIDFSNSEEVLQASIKVLNIIDQVAQKMNIPSLRALSHWMLLNTEKNDSNADSIKELCSSGSYFNWIEILSSLLQTEEQSLLDELQKHLNHPNWFIKPSNILITDLTDWIETTTNIQAKVELENSATTDKDNSLANNNDISHAYKETELEDPSYYKEIALTKTASEHPKQHTPILNNPVVNTENKAFQNEDCLGKLGLELDEIVMSLFNLSNTSEDVLQDYEIFNNKLEQLIVFANSCSYSSIAQICRWCQRNIDLFARNKSVHHSHFLESGESWAWLELVSYCINEPDEPSNLSLMNSELNRKEWMEPIAVEDLQNLFLFLKDPKDQVANKGEEENNNAEEGYSKNTSASLPDSNDSIDLPKDNQEVNTSAELEQQTGLSFTWDEDTHPELLSAYFEETPDLVTKIAELLQKIYKTETSKEERQHASRIAHTIKGGSAVLGITALSELSHKLEDILDYSVNNDLSKEVLTHLSESSEHLIKLFDSIKNQQNPPKNYPQILAKLTSAADSLASENPEDDDLLTLSMPTLPDFINPVDVDSLDTDSTEEIEGRDEKNEINNKINTDEETLIEEATSKTLEIINKPPIALDNENDNSDFSAEMDDIVMSLSMIEISPDNPFLELNKNNLVKINEELQRLDLLSEISGYPEISKISQWCQNNLQQLFNQQNDNSKDFLISGGCWTWLELTSASLADPEETSYLAELSQALMNPQWIDPIKTEDLQAILLLLNSARQANHANLDDTEENNKTDSFSTPKDNLANDLANNIDNNIKTSQENLEQLAPATTNTSPDTQYSFSWDDDIHPELLSVYLQETPEQIAEAAQLIYKITENKASKEDHQHAARMVHTIKGASGVVGITALAEFTHKLEDILEYSVGHSISAELSSLLNESADCLEDLFETIINKKTPPLEFSPLLSQLTQQATALQNSHGDDTFDALESEELKMPELPDFIKAQDSNNLETSLSNPAEDKISEPTEITEQKTQSTAPTVATETHIRVPIKVIDQLLNLAGELVTTTTQISDKIENSLLTNKQTKEQDHHVYKIIDELGATISKQEKNQSQRLNTLQNSTFDSLEMDTYNELHSITGLLAESILDGEEIDRQLGQQLTELSDYTRSLGRLNKELSDLILHSRMVSVNTLIPKLERIIRQTCRKTGKKAELAITGNDINIDTDILNKLSDPLLHLLRNSVDHGIETPQERKAKNKYETGRIHLTFSREDKYICMELKDDGAGIDTNIVYQRALKMGMINSEAEYTKKEILQLILQAGFTTQNKVTDISGRGVGMDVVNDAVKSLKGTLEISSEKDQGTCFTIKAPLTLVTSATLIVEVSKHQVAIPADSIEQLFYLASSLVIEKDGAQYIQHDNQELPIISLASLLGWPVKQPDFSITNTLLIIKGKKEIHAVYIDKIVQSREIVIKSLAPWINTDNGLIGACHLPDGGVAPVINLSQLLSNGEKSTETIEKFQLTTTEPDNSIDKTPLVLIVDDSLSNRKALSLIIEQTEYDVVTAVDGLDALKIINENEIDIVFTDLEMPRMNGLELTQAIRAWDTQKHTPIVMITSRTTNKHKQLAQKAGVNQYLTKPVITETLLESLEHWLTYRRQVQET